MYFSNPSLQLIVILELSCSVAFVTCPAFLAVAHLHHLISFASAPLTAPDHLCVRHLVVVSRVLEGRTWYRTFHFPHFRRSSDVINCSAMIRNMFSVDTSFLCPAVYVILSEAISYFPFQIFGLTLYAVVGSQVLVVMSFNGHSPQQQLFFAKSLRASSASFCVRVSAGFQSVASFTHKS